MSTLKALCQVAVGERKLVREWRKGRLPWEAVESPAVGAYVGISPLYCYYVGWGYNWRPLEHHPAFRPWLRDDEKYPILLDHRVVVSRILCPNGTSSLSFSFKHMLRRRLRGKHEWTTTGIGVRSTHALYTPVDDITESIWRPDRVVTLHGLVVRSGQKIDSNLPWNLVCELMVRLVDDEDLTMLTQTWLGDVGINARIRSETMSNAAYHAYLNKKYPERRILLNDHIWLDSELTRLRGSW